jgi:hypothetical protein
MIGHQVSSELYQICESPFSVGSKHLQCFRILGVQFLVVVGRWIRHDGESGWQVVGGVVRAIKSA